MKTLLPTKISTRINKVVKKSELQLRPEVWEDIQRESREFREGKRYSPEFTNVEDAIFWLHRKEK
jgi:hypothetical protein